MRPIREDQLEPSTINYELLPEHMRESARLYIERGIMPGSFMVAILRNDFTGAALVADPLNLMRLQDYAIWLNIRCPPDAWGDMVAIKKWSDNGGINGRRKEKRPKEKTKAVRGVDRKTG